MPVFGEFETNDEPFVVTPTRNQTTTVWLARKSGAKDGRQFAVKSVAVHRGNGTHGADEALGADPGLEFIETIKQLKKAESQGARDFAPIHSFGTSDLGCWYATDYCARGSLKTWINLRGGVDTAALRHVVLSLAEGCNSLKRICGRSHGNLKPSNVLLHGKARPLKSTPLLMVDPMPVSTSRVSSMGTSERAMVESIFEAQDLRAIGELILQLVEGRLIESGSDYNYPIESSPPWRQLGKDERRWRELCNRLIDPQLQLEQTNLNSLARALPTVPVMEKLLVPAATCVVLAAIGSGIYFYSTGAFARHVQAAETARNDADWKVAAREIQKALKIKPNDSQALKLAGETFTGLVQFARRDVDSGDWKTAKEELTLANALKANDPIVSRLNRQMQMGQAYQVAMQTGQQAFENKQYDTAIQQADLALQDTPGDLDAQNLRKDAATAKKAQEAQAAGEKQQGYASAIDAVHLALGSGKYDEAIRQADTALEYEPGDAEANRLKTQAQNAKNAAAAKAAAVQLAYQTAIQTAQHDLESKNYSDALKQANVALSSMPGDAQAAQLQTAAQNGQNYLQAMAAAKTALSQNDYNEAVRQAQIALASEPDDADATKLKNAASSQAQAAADAQVHQRYYQKAMDAGRAALANKQYDEAERQANIALANVPGDSQAEQLKSDAQSQSVAAADAQARRQHYNAAMTAARDALQKQDFSTAVAQAKVALQNEPDDADATRIENDAEARAKAIADAKARKQNYDTAMTAGRAAFSKGQFANAIDDANTALSNEPDDAQAARLLSDAQTKKQILDAAEARQRAYDSAMASGRAAYSAKNYQEAVTQARAALKVMPGDKAATKLQADSLVGLDNFYLASANTDLGKGNFAQAIQYAKAAMAIKDDPIAKSIETRAASEQKTLSELDTQLSILMKNFGVGQESGSSIVPNPKAQKIVNLDDPSVVAQYVTLTTRLEEAYKNGGWLDLEKRRALLEHVRKNLNNY